MNLETNIHRFLEDKATLYTDDGLHGVFSKSHSAGSVYSLPPLLDLLGVGILLQTLGDVVSDLDEALPRVLQLLALRQALLWPVQLFERRLHRPHPLFALKPSIQVLIIMIVIPACA